jgi:hypothetical protein
MKSIDIPPNLFEQYVLHTNIIHYSIELLLIKQYVKFVQYPRMFFGNCVSLQRLFVSDDIR